MTKTLKDFMEVYKPKSPDEQKFVDKHVTIKHKDRNGNGDDVFNASKIKPVKRKEERHGYAAGEDEKVYEEVEDLDEAKQVSYKDYTITSGHRTPGSEAGDIKHSIAHPKKLAQLGIDHDDAGDYGETRRLTVRNNKTGETTHHHVYQREWDSGKNKPVVSIRSVGKPQAASEKHHNVIASYLSGKTKLKEDVEDLDEKTLTPAEMKKREEVVKAIKSGNPKMDKSIAYAIATKTAKRVAEEAEELDEAGLVVPRRDNLVSLKQHSFPGADEAPKKIKLTKGWGDGGKSMKSSYGKLAKEEVEDLDEKLSDEAKDVIRKTVKSTGAKVKPLIKLAQMGKKTPIKPMDEEAEQIDELSKATLRSYAQNAKDQMSRSDTLAGREMGARAAGAKPSARERMHNRRADKRHAGLGLAIDKLAREEVEQVDELSKKTLGNYTYKAASELGSRGITTGLKIAADEPTEKNFKKMGNRQKGIATAVKKLTKEDIINRTIEKYIPEAEQLSDEERLIERLEGLSEAHIHLLLSVFEGLNDDNRMRMLGLVETREGINSMIDFALENRGD